MTFFALDAAMTRKTILNDTHRALGAKMVDFGGWDMPIHYGSQIDEHHQVRKDAGMFDVSHMTVVDLHGARVRDFLRRLVANSVDKLKKPGKALYTAMLDENGGVIDDLIVYFMAEGFYRLVVNAATRDKDLAWIGKQAEAFEVQVTERPEFAMIAVQGPTARAKVIGLLREADRAAAEKLDALRRRRGADTRRGTVVRRPYRIHRRRWIRDRAAPGAGGGVLECIVGHRGETRRPGRARYLAPGSRHEPLRSGHG